MAFGALALINQSYIIALSTHTQRSLARNCLQALELCFPYTLWTRSEAPLASFPFRAKNLGPEAWQEFRTTTDGKWFSQDRT